MTLRRFRGEGKDKREEIIPGYQVGEDPRGYLWAGPADFFDAGGIYTGHLPEVSTMRAPQSPLDPYGEDA